ncbi:MAG TPA: EamA/RhaT family transporter [Sphingobacteriaceae bacterium]
MIYILISICCNITVGVLFKLARRYRINAEQAIVWNYLTAILLSWLFFDPQTIPAENIPYLTYLALGILLPVMFVVIARSIRHTGIVRTDVAQRLSLFIPVVAAYLLFQEMFSWNRIGGIALGFLAITCSIPWQKAAESKKQSAVTWYYPLTVFIGMGIIDILFKQIAQAGNIPYTSSLFVVFVIAFILSGAVLCWFFLTRRLKFEWINVVCGIFLGLFNFGNILFYLKAHQALARTPSVVFSGMNIGVIILGSLVGLLIFREKLTRLNYAGILLAIISIIIISFG